MALCEVYIEACKGPRASLNKAQDFRRGRRRLARLIFFSAGVRISNSSARDTEFLHMNCGKDACRSGQGGFQEPGEIQTPFT